MELVIKGIKWLFVFSLFALLCSCAKENEESVDDIEQRLIDAYLYANPGYTTMPSGLCYKVEQTGTGYEQPVDGSFVFVNYTGYDFKGNIVINATVPYSNSESIAKQLGTFAYTKYYGPKLWGINNSTLYKGLEDAVKKMKAGGKMRVIMPSKLSTIGSSAKSLSAPMIVDIELLVVAPDIAKYETNELASYSYYHYPSLDSLKYNFYLKRLKSGTGYPAEHGDTVDVRYVGYLLDGFVFDTNIADTASLYRIYDKAKDYAVLTVILDTARTANDYVQGFKEAIMHMSEKEEAVTFFSSSYGYKSQGSGEIQPYSPLRFYMKVERIGRKTEE